MHTGKYQEAIDAYDSALAIDPTLGVSLGLHNADCIYQVGRIPDGTRFL